MRNKAPHLDVLKVHRVDVVKPVVYVHLRHVVRRIDFDLQPRTDIVAARVKVATKFSCRYDRFNGPFLAVPIMSVLGRCLGDPLGFIRQLSWKFVCKLFFLIKKKFRND